MNLDFLSLGKNIQKKVIGTQVEENPYPHLYLENAIEDDVLQDLYRLFPSESLFNKEGAGLKTFQVWSDAKDLQSCPPHIAAFFHRLNEQVFTRELADILFAKFQLSFEQLYKKLFVETSVEKLQLVKLDDWDQAGALNIREQRSVLPVHLDWPNRLISVVIYLAPDGDWNDDWGTRLYSVDRARVPKPLDVFSRKITPETAAIDNSSPTLLPFKPGNMAVFMNSPWSYHGAEVTPQDSNAGRWCLVKCINLTLSSTELLFGLPDELR